MCSRLPELSITIVALSFFSSIGIWERTHAANAMGVPVERVPIGFTVGFEVDGVDDAARTLGARGIALLQTPHDEPWGQRTARFLSASGMLAEVSETPNARTLPADGSGS